MRRNSEAVALTAALAAAVVVAVAPAQARDYATTARNVIPSGQYGSVPPPPEASRQAEMYDGLTPLFDDIANGDLNRFFKSEALGGAGSDGPLTAQPSPRDGLTIQRDSFNVPHIRGETNDDVTFGAGWVTAQDRELLLEQARGASRTAAVDAPGLNALGLVASLRSFEPSAQTEREVAMQTGALRRLGRKGRAVLHDIDVFVAGINAYYRANDKPHDPWTRNDVYALNALKGQFVGEGGGGEVRSSLLLSGLQRRLGAGRGERVWNDLRQRQDPETTVSVDGRFPYAPLPRRRRGNVILDNGSFEPAGGATASAALGSPRPPASNILMVNGSRSQTGRPLMVGGPQIGYFYPGLTLEMSLQGPGWQARGATTAPLPGYILIGRGEDFAHSLTSAGTDIIDHYVETLCGGSDTRYLYKGRCRRMTTFDAGTLAAGGGEPERRVTFQRTVHGPVVGYATVRGRRVAISRKRSTYGIDVTDQLFYRDLTRGKVRSVESFFRAASQSPQTFNSFYVDDRDVAMFTSGRLPVRPRTVDSGLPVDGRGRYEWRGFASRGAHPQGYNPRRGYLTNWNNKPARGFPASDDQYGYGSIQRVDMLDRGLAKRRRHTLASVTGAMNAAATQDVRALELLPVLARALRRGEATSERAATMLRLLEQWRGEGASRLDRDLDGGIDAPGAAILDEAWPGIANATLDPVLGGALADQLDDGLMSRFDAPPGGQFTGWHQYLDKDLRALLEPRRVSGRFETRFCGRGSLERCSRSLWAALDAAGASLAAEQGEDPAAWRADATAERIEFVPGLLSTTMRYTNRPTGIQQVISFRGHTPGPRALPRIGQRDVRPRRQGQRGPRRPLPCGSRADSQAAC